VTLARLEVENFRCISSANLEFSPTRNVVTGENGTGKTSLLEAIYLLGSGHSFRSAPLNSLIRAEQHHFLVVGKLDQIYGGVTTVGVRCLGVETEFSVNGRPPGSLGDLVRHFPVQVIDPEIHRLLEDGPSRRRRFIDWGVFHVEHAFQNAWRYFNRAIKQRNAALKAGSSPDLHIWDADVVRYGELIGAYRQQYLAALRPFIDEVAKRLLSFEVELEYIQGWRRNSSLLEALDESRLRDLQRGTTSVGPHRAELVLKADGHPARDRISRGQQKMLACTLILAQQRHRASLGAAPGCLLLDDPAAELDVANLGKLLEIVDSLSVQLIVTALSDFGLEILRDGKLFHVEHGTVKAMA